MFYIDNDSAHRRNAQHSLRGRNIKRLFNIIHLSGRITRAELVRRSGLSPSTVSSLVGDLVRTGLVRELGLAQHSANSGRRPILLSVEDGGRHIPVFSLGDCGISYTLYDLGYRALDEVFRPYSVGAGGNGNPAFRDAGEAYAAIIAQVLEEQSPHLDMKRAAAVLISYPGIYLEEERSFLLTATKTSFQMEAIYRLQRRIGVPVFVGNSSVSLAYAEKKRLDDLGKPVEELIYVNICSGVGAGIISRREMLNRPGRTAGEIGHMTIEMDGRPCLCGNRGCLEQYVSLNAIYEEVRRSVSGDVSGAHAQVLRELLSDMTLDRIGRAYTMGVDSVRQALDRIARWLAAGICSAVNVTGIKCVILGGIEALGEDFLTTLRRLVCGDPARFLMRNTTLMYQHIRPEDEGLGIAQYYLDKMFSVSEEKLTNLDRMIGEEECE